MNGIAEFLKTLGPARIAALGLVTLASLGFFMYVGMRVTEPKLSLLYAEMNVDDAALVISELDALAVPYELKGDGTKIFVPDDKVLRLRMALAEKGLPSGGSVGYEIFDNADALGTTSFVQNLNHLRALEGELSRTIRAISNIQAARVHLVMPEREVFSREKRQPSASIILKVRGTGLTLAQVKAIQHLTASAVDGLTPGKVSIVDEQGTLLASGADDDDNGMLNMGLEDRNSAYENKLRTQLEQIVQRIVGPDKARVEVAAELDFSRITQTSDTFDPESQVVRSTQTVEETSANSNATKNNGVSVGNSLPDATLGDAGNETSQESANRIEETVNFEISHITKTEVLEAGRVKRLSVAVLVDGTYATGPDASIVYEPRSSEELEQIGALIRSAMGYNAARGDVVEVVNLRFAEPPAIEPTPEEAGPFLGLHKQDYWQIAELGVLSILSVLILLFIVRPIVLRAIGTTVAAPSQQALAAGGEAQAQLPGPQTAGQLLPSPPELSEAESMIDIAKVEGKVKESSVRKIGELVAGHPDESLSILRSWLYENT